MSKIFVQRTILDQQGRSLRGPGRGDNKRDTGFRAGSHNDGLRAVFPCRWRPCIRCSRFGSR